jgi:hypothetical protein
MSFWSPSFWSSNFWGSIWGTSTITPTDPHEVVRLVSKIQLEYERDSKSTTIIEKDSKI